MRMVFGVLSLLVVLAIIGSLAKKQLQAVSVPVEPSGTAASAPPPSGTPAQQSQQLQRRVADDVSKALEQGASRLENESAQ
ncbi:MAG: hypothetical protein OEM00_03420 [Burkholderiaceae bacterium]|nr:hypothetical protein [Burkholderiaceae bacterium]